MEAHLAGSAEPDPSTAPPAQRESSLMQSINGTLRQRPEALADPDPIAFFCECRRPGCYSTVWMSAAGFDARMSEESGWLLAEGHEPSALWEGSAPVPSTVGAAAAPTEAPAEPEPPADDPSRTPPGALLEHELARPPTARPRLRLRVAKRGVRIDDRGDLARRRP